MKTTVEIPADLYRQAKVRAAAEGRKMRDLVAEGLVLILRGERVTTDEVVRPISAFDAMQDVCGCVATGVSDLATNPAHMKDFGRG